MRRKSITSKMMKNFIAESLLLLMEHQSFEEITVGEIVRKAGVNRSTYYRHFANKEDVILYFLDSLSEDILEWDKEQKPEFRLHLINLFSHYRKHKEQMLTIYRNGQFHLFLNILKKHLGRSDEHAETSHVQYNVAFHIGGTFNHFLLWLSRDMTDSPEEMADHTLSVLPPELIEHIWILSK